MIIGGGKSGWVFSEGSEHVRKVGYFRGEALQAQYILAKYGLAPRIVSVALSEIKTIPTESFKEKYNPIQALELIEKYSLKLNYFRNNKAYIGWAVFDRAPQSTSNPPLNLIMYAFRMCAELNVVPRDCGLENIAFGPDFFQFVDCGDFFIKANSRGQIDVKRRHIIRHFYPNSTRDRSCS